MGPRSSGKLQALFLAAEAGYRSTMPRRTGSADLPLHGGKVPLWLASRMARLGRVIVEALLLEVGRDEVLRRLADPFWFQSLGAVMGMDWHSSGITTSVMGALKRGLEPVQHELGLHICGGRGRHSRATPAELLALGDRLGIDGQALGQTSRLVAKVDSAAVQDGFDIYLHSFVVTDDGAWTVVQQGMCTARRQARRYHWLSEGLRSFVEEPHSAIAGPRQGEIINLTDRRAALARQTQVDLVCAGPDLVVETLRQARDGGAPGRHLQLPAHHDVRASDVVLRRLHGAIAAAATRGPADFQSLLLTGGVGARTIRALALVGEVLYGAPCRFDDPARFSFAHGGKDGHPFPVPLRVYDRTLAVLRQAVEAARLGRDEKLAALRRLAEQARRLERAANGPDLSALVVEERARAPLHGGRTVFDDVPRPLPAAKQLQLPWSGPDR
jgi:uncharacterized protein